MNISGMIHAAPEKRPAVFGLNQWVYTRVEHATLRGLWRFYMLTWRSEINRAGDIASQIGRNKMMCILRCTSGLLYKHAPNLKEKVSSSERAEIRNAQHRTSARRLPHHLSTYSCCNQASASPYCYLAQDMSLVCQHSSNHLPSIFFIAWLIIS